METLPTISNNVLLPGDATPVQMRMDAKRFPRVNSMTRDAAIENMYDIVVSAALYKGNRLDEAEIRFTATALVDEILCDKSFGLAYISFAEIRRAVRRAVLETEMYGVNVASLYRAIVAYAKGEGTQATLAAQQRSARPSSPQIALDAAAAELVKTHLTR